MKHKWSLIGTALLGLLLLSVGAAGAEMHVALGEDVEGWDPATVIFYAAGEIVRNCYDSLITYEILDAEDSPAGVAMFDESRPKGMLAESWEVSPDGKEYTFYLRQDVVFASGNEFTSEDVRWTVERSMNIPGGTGWLWDVIGVSSMDQVEVIDDHTIRFVLDEPNTLFLPSLQLEVMAIVDSAELKKHVTEDDPYAHNWMYTNVAPTGPFHVAEYVPGSRIVLEANPNYYGGEPKTQRVVYHIVPSEATRIMLLEAGDVDVSLFISPEEVQRRLVDRPGIDVVSVATPGTEYLAINTTLPPFDDVLVRRAIAHAVNYDELMEEVMHGFASPATSPVPALTPGHKDVFHYEHDPEKARELLEEAGYPDGIQVELSYRLDNPVEEAVAIYLQDQFAEAGIDLVIDRVAASRFERIRVTREYQMALIYWTPYVNDPVYQLSFNYHSRSECCNYGEYHNPTVNSLVDQATRETDPDKQQELIDELQEIIADDVPIVYLYHPDRITCMRSEVEGFVYNSAHFLLYRYMYKD